MKPRGPSTSLRCPGPCSTELTGVYHMVSRPLSLPREFWVPGDRLPCSPGQPARRQHFQTQGGREPRAATSTPRCCSSGAGTENTQFSLLNT